jgi:hypothetical protein
MFSEHEHMGRGDSVTDRAHSRGTLAAHGTCRMRCVHTYLGEYIAYSVYPKCTDNDGRQYAKIRVESRLFTPVAQANVETGVVFGDDLIRKALSTSLLTQTEAFVFEHNSRQHT